MPPSRGPTPRARARRRAGRQRLAAVAGLALLLAVLLIAGLTGGSGAKPSASRVASRHKAKVAAIDPLSTLAVKQLVASRQGDISAAVEDLSTGKEWLLSPSARDQTASIIKVDILETLLHSSDASDTDLASAETDVAQQMIEASDDDDATELWDEIGGASGIGAYNQLAGLTQTTPNTEGYWGETLTSAADQLLLLRQLALPSKLLSPAAQAYELDLMENIDPGQTWGVTGGVPSGVTVALKNGWVPLTSNTDWEINSIGWVKGDGKDYLIAVLTAHDPSQDYGETTIGKLAADVWKAIPGSAAKAVGATTSPTTRT